MNEKNELMEEVMNFTYKDEKVEFYKRKYLKAKKERMKDKFFKEIISGAVKERGVIMAKDVVLMEEKVYKELLNTAEQLNKEKERLEEVMKKSS